MPNLVADQLQPIDPDDFAAPGDPRHPPRIAVLCGSLRAVSYSRLCAEEGARVLRARGCGVRVFDATGLPLPDEDSADQPRVRGRPQLVDRCSGRVGMLKDVHRRVTS